MTLVSNIRKQRSRVQSGFTLVETMLALAILVLLTGIVASGIPVASQTYEKTVDAANAEVALTTTAAKLRDELGLAQDVFYATAADSTTGEHSVAFYKRSDGYWARIVNPTGDEKSLYIEAYAGVPNVRGSSDNNYGLGDPLQTTALVPDNTMVGNLKILGGATPNSGGSVAGQPITISYNSENGIFTINDLKVVSTKGTTETALADIGDNASNRLRIKAALY